MKVSVLILTYNEEEALPRCLAALNWCDDVIVVDSGSTDATVDIARRAGARVLHRPFDNFAEQRNFGLDEGRPRHAWVLHLDADEVVTPGLRDRLVTLEPEPGVDAYRVPSKLMLGERWLRHAGMYPTYQVRLGKAGRLRFKQFGHGQREDLPHSRIGTLDEPYLHYAFSKGLGSWLRKHIRYAEDDAKLILSLRDGAPAVTQRVFGSEAGTQHRHSLRETSARLPLLLRPIICFLYVVIWRRGFLDGRYGVLYGLMRSVYEGMTAIFAVDELLRKRSVRAAGAMAAPDGKGKGETVSTGHD